jgi:integrase
MPKLTKTLVDGLKPGETDQWVWDTEAPGFGVRVQPSGRKTYVARYRTVDGKVQRKMTLARCTDMPPDRARDLARKVFASVAAGEDPAAQRRQDNDAPTVADLERRFTKEHAIPFKKASSRERDDINWRCHILPALGTKRVRDLTKADILKLQGSLSEKPAVANQCVAILSKALNLAEDWEWRAPGTNPCRRLKKYKIPERDLILTPEQIACLDAALTELVNDGAIRPAFAAFVRLLMLTGCRKSEIMEAKRSWVDFERRLLLLPDSKVGQRRIPLSQTAIDIIKALPENEWLIPGRLDGRSMQSPYGTWAIVKARAGLPKALRIHDLRHGFASLGHMAGLTQKQIATALGHRQLSTTERYLHGIVGDQAKVADKMAEVIAGNWGKPAAAA